jgi:hypothetical protein
VDEADDFYPAFGTFRTPIYEIPVRIGEAAFTMRVGSLPSPLRDAPEARDRRDRGD